MDDKTIMNTLLNETKGMCGLMMHGSIESATPKVRKQFDSALKESLTMQKDIYQKMTEKGWYQMQNVEKQTVQQTKQKFEAKAETKKSQ